MKKYQCLAALFLMIPLAASSIELGPATAPENGFLAQPLFNPTALMDFAPAIQSFKTWSDSSEGRSLIQNTNENVRLWADFIRSSDSPESAAILAPLFKALPSEPAESLKKNIAALSAAKNDKDREALLEKIARKMRQAGGKASPKVFEILKNYEAQLKLASASSHISPQTFQQAKALDQALAPIANIYAQNPEQKEIIKNLSRSLAHVQARHISETLEPFWASGKKPLEDSYAGKLEKDPTLSPDAPREGPLWMKTVAPAQDPSRLNLVDPAQFPHIFIPTHEDLINLGGQSVRRTLFPNVPNGTGDDIPSILAAGNRASKSTRIMLYEETLDEDVASILEGIKQGRKFEIIADYSNLFPQKVGRKTGTRSPQLQQLVNAYLARNPNLDLYALKGIGSIGIQHAKYRIWNIPLPNGQNHSIIEGGSYNYSTHSQEHNWENVVLIDDPKLIKIYNQFFNWAKSIAHPFSEDLEPEDPVIKTPIPRDSALGQSFNNVRLPIASFSPNGQTGDAWTKIINNSKQGVLIGMFGFYPWIDLMSTLISRLNSGLPIRVLADIKQSHNASSIADMKRVKDAGAEVRVIGGASEDGLFHNKLLFGDPQDSGIVATGSTNMSYNGTRHNFENTVYLKGSYLGALIDYMEALWNMGSDPDYSQLSIPQGGQNPTNNTPQP